jgi:hypothetical protein
MQSTKFVPLNGSPPIPTQVDCPRPTAVVWKTWKVNKKNIVPIRLETNKLRCKKKKKKTLLLKSQNSQWYLLKHEADGHIKLYFSLHIQGSNLCISKLTWGTQRERPFLTVKLGLALQTINSIASYQHIISRSNQALPLHRSKFRIEKLFQYDQVYGCRQALYLFYILPV